MDNSENSTYKARNLAGGTCLQSPFNFAKFLGLSKNQINPLSA